MSQEKVYRYGRLSGHHSAAVMDAQGKLIMECLREPKQPRLSSSSEDCRGRCPSPSRRELRLPGTTSAETPRRPVGGL